MVVIHIVIAISRARPPLRLFFQCLSMFLTRILQKDPEKDLQTAKSLAKTADHNQSFSC